MIGDCWIAVIADMRERRLKGIADYGKPVWPYAQNTDWLQHAYEEALDLCVYLKAEMERQKAKSIGLVPNQTETK